MKTVMSVMCLLMLSGCAATKALDTTAALQALAAGEAKVTYTVVPGSVAGMPDNTLAIPTVPGKNVKFRAYYPDGQPQWELDTSRDAIVTAMLSGAAGVDAAKFAHDQWIMEQFLTRIDALTSRLLPLVEAKLSAPPAAPSGPSMRDTLLGLLTDPEYLARLKAALK